MSDNVKAHERICDELNQLYERKNHDYGGSFHLTYQKWGLPMAAIRLEDKLQRFETLIKAEKKVKDESIRDTLIDLANYSIMTVMELDNPIASTPDPQKKCGNCKYHRRLGNDLFCYGRAVLDSDLCDGWKPEEKKPEMMDIPARMEDSDGR